MYSIFPDIRVHSDHSNPMYRDRVADTVKGIQNKCLSREQMRKDREDEGRRGSGENSLLPFSHSFSFADRPFPAAFSRSPGSRSLAGLESSLGRSGTRQKAAFILHKAAAAATTRKEEEEEAYHPDRNAGRDRNSSIYLSTFFNSDRRPS